jgi:BMFP domain-containing protein YqiC
MQSRNRMFDDLAKVANGAVSTFVGLKGEVEAMVRQQMEKMLSRMDVVPRDEFDAVKAVAAKARTEQEKLERRVAALEAQLAGRGTSARKKPARKNRKKA